MASLTNLAAVDGGKGNDYLGSLCWYTIYDLSITRTDLLNRFLEAGLSTIYMPNEIRPVGAFRRATAELEENRKPYSDVYQNFLIREVLCDKDSVIRQLIRETVDAKNVRLNYDKVGEVVFHRDYEQIRVMDYGAGEKLDKVEELYQEYRNTYDGQHIRRVVRSVIADMNPAAVRPSGGVYFVPQRYKEKLSALERLVKLLGSEFFTMPVIDLESSRDMLYEKFREQIQEQVSKMTELLRGGEASKRQMEQAVKGSKKMFDQIREYEGMLNKNLGDLKVSVDILKQQIVSLLDVA